MTALITKYGKVKGFFPDPTNPYYDIGLTYMEWEFDGKQFDISAMGITFRGEDDFEPTTTS